MSLAAIARGRSWPRARWRAAVGAVVLTGFAFVALLASPSAGARGSAIHLVSIVKATIVGPYLNDAGVVVVGPHVESVMQPNQIQAHAGDKVKLCNKTAVISKLFSPSHYNTFGGGADPTDTTGVKVNPGACITVQVHNPTNKPLKVVIADELQTNELLEVTVASGCAPHCGTPPPPAPTYKPGTFLLEKEEIKNPNPDLLIDSSGPFGRGGFQADWNHVGQYGGAGNGGDWVVHFSWRVPVTLVAGKVAPITIGADVLSENPPQPNSYQIVALAPDFSQAVSFTYPNPTQKSEHYDVPISASYSATPFKELTITIGVVSANVIYHYERVG